MTCWSLILQAVSLPGGGHPERAGEGRSRVLAVALRLQFERRPFGGGYFAGLEVLADADAAQSSVHPPRDHAVSIFEPGHAESLLVHAQVATSTGQPSFCENLSGSCLPA